ncbi:MULTISPECIES: tetratricopeptide repeat protein [Pseudanabaena]|uniref:tetratricopeptide repeat protein n=1 Tax=Pseudanabaena TaxID=1152 RepID=UPI00389AADED
MRLNPNLAETYYNRGNTYQNLGEKQKALVDFREASRLYRQQGKISDYEDAENRIRKLGE